MSNTMSVRELLHSMPADEQAAMPRENLLKLRRATFQEHFSSMALPEPVHTWAMLMKTLYPGGVQVWEHLLPWEIALLVVRYGEDTRHWPAAFSDDDLLRARQWANGKTPNGVVYPKPMSESLVSLALLAVCGLGFAWAVLHDSSWGLLMLFPLLGTAMSDYLEAQMATHMLRTGLTTLNAWATIAYVAGDVVRPATWNNRIYQCVVGGTSSGTEPAFTTTIGNETTDSGGVVWLCCAVGLPKRPLFFALYTAAPGETGGGTEVTGGSYARVNHTPSDANWTAAGTNGLSDNATVITFATPTANWGLVTHMAIHERLTGGNMSIYGALTQSKTINNGDPAPTFPVGALDLTYA